MTDPDPTEGPELEEASRLSAEENIARFGVRRGAGEPEAPALPGQRDISKPQIALPEGVGQLIDSLRGELGGSAPKATGEQDAGRLLDFLLGP